jgi:hypothetical protein
LIPSTTRNSTCTPRCPGRPTSINFKNESSNTVKS